VNGYNVAAAVQTTSSISSTTVSSSTRAISRTGLPTSGAGKDNHSSKLSTGAKAGIGIGVSLGALALLGAIAFMFFARRRKQAGGIHESAELMNNNGAPAVGELEGGKIKYVPNELEGSEVRREFHG